MRQTITIPADGKKVRVNGTGRSLIVEKCNTYETVEDVPTFVFAPGNNKNPLYPRSKYVNSNGAFNFIEVYGTAESEGDEITLYLIDECIDPEINILFSETYSRSMGTTFTKTANDVAQSLSALDLADSDGNLPVKLYVGISPLISTPERGIKYAFNTDPVQGEETKGYYLGAGSIELLELDGVDAMLAFRYIADSPGETPLVNFTPEY